MQRAASSRRERQETNAAFPSRPALEIAMAAQIVPLREREKLGEGEGARRRCGRRPPRRLGGGIAWSVTAGGAGKRAALAGGVCVCAVWYVACAMRTAAGRRVCVYVHVYVLVFLALFFWFWFGVLFLCFVCFFGLLVFLVCCFSCCYCLKFEFVLTVCDRGGRCGSGRKMRGKLLCRRSGCEWRFWPFVG